MDTLYTDEEYGVQEGSDIIVLYYTIRKDGIILPFVDDIDDLTTN